MENIFQNFAAGVGAHTLHTHSAESNGRLLVPKKKSDWLGKRQTHIFNKITREQQFKVGFWNTFLLNSTQGRKLRKLKRLEL